MEKIPGSNTPIMSPAYASSTIFRSCAIICWGWERRISLSALHMADFHVGIKLSGADTHKGNPVPVRLVHVRLDFKDKGGKIIFHRDQSVPMSAFRGSGVVVIFKKCCRKCLHAEVCQGGTEEYRRQICRLLTSSKSNSALAPSRSSISSMSLSAAACPITATSSSVSAASISVALPSFVPFSVSE